MSPTTTTTIALAFYMNGRQMITRYEPGDPQWRQAVQLLKEQGRPFKLRYLYTACD